MIRTILVALFAACAAVADVKDDAWNWYENEALPLGGKAFTDTETFFERWPAAAKGKLPGGLVSMGRHTTGMYLRFSTDSDKIRIEWKVRDEHPYDPLIPEAGLIGLDVYGWDASVDGGKGAWRFQGNKRYWPRDRKNPGTAQFSWTPGRPCIVYLPLRATMVSFRIGVAKGKTIKPHPYRVPDAKPIVHYGTSIVHGGCASRPGLAFTAVAARDLDLPYVNLGFSGAAKMEASVPEFLAAADASLYVIDARWNMSPALVATNCAPFLRKMKELKPDVPILLCEGCTVRDHDSCNPAFRKVYRAQGRRPREVAQPLLLRGEDDAPQGGPGGHARLLPSERLRHAAHGPRLRPPHPRGARRRGAEEVMRIAERRGVW